MLTETQAAFLLIYALCWLALALRYITGQTIANDDQTVEYELIGIEEGTNKNASTSSSSSSSTTTTTRRSSGSSRDHIRDALWHAVRFGTIMAMYMYSASYEPFAAKKHWDADWFWALHLLLLLASFLTLRQSKSKDCGVVFNRDQTEEWKGWMQVIFLAYHYYAAHGGVYKLVRVLIGAYVWMTGYGHMTYFMTAKNYDFVRVVRTLLRLNWLVLWTCLATGNSYMLYYICPMHTFWFFTVYVVMYIGRQYNAYNTWFVPMKLLATFVLITMLYEIPGLFKLMFRPWKLLLEYSGDGLHEWEFRTGLDRYAAWLGMACGFARPHVQSFFEYIENESTVREWTVKGLISGVFIIATGSWYQNVFVKEKFAYNASHPYWEFIPILAWLWFRNITKTLRSWYLHLFAWWGRVTLESYISQLHILLTLNAKAVILIWPEYPIINMILCALVFGACSKVLLNSTIALTDVIAPINNHAATVQHLLYGAVGLICSVAIVHFAHIAV